MALFLTPLSAFCKVAVASTSGLTAAWERAADFYNAEDTEESHTAE